MFYFDTITFFIQHSVDLYFDIADIVALIDLIDWLID